MEHCQRWKKSLRIVRKLLCIKFIQIADCNKLKTKTNTHSSKEGISAVEHYRSATQKNLKLIKRNNFRCNQNTFTIGVIDAYC